MSVETTRVVTFAVMYQCRMPQQFFREEHEKQFYNDVVSLFLAQGNKIPPFPRINEIPGWLGWHRVCVLTMTSHAMY